MAGTAAAHTDIAKVDPDRGEELASAPEKVTITFAGEIRSGILSFQVTDGCGKDRALRATAQGRTLTIFTSDGDPGLWIPDARVVSDDGHETRAQYAFVVTGDAACPDAQAQKPSPATPTLTADEPKESSGSPLRLPLLFATGALLIAGLVVVARSGGKKS